MAIFDNELIDNTSSPEPIQGPGPKEFLGSIDTMKVDTSMGGFENFASNTQPPGKTGLGIKELSNLNIRTDNASFSSPFQMVSNKELSQNQRYDMYERDANLENIHGLNQGWASQLANGVVKMGATAVGTFAQGFATIPNTIASVKNGSVTALAGDPNGYEGTIDNWLKNIEDIFPNYYSDKEKDHPYLAAIPFAPGSANFWGDKVIKNLGFIAGAIASAAVQDIAVGAVTEGIGELPLIGAQIGKASLWLNKLFNGSEKLDRVLDIARGLGKTEQQIFNMKGLAQAAASTKISNGFRYGMNVYGSARTEAGVEARDGYRQVRQELLDQYKLDNLGAEPTGADAQEIEDYATDSMNTRFGLNMAILTVSNAIQFDNLFKSFTNAGGGITGGLTKDLQGAGKLGLKEGSLDVFERKAATGIGGKVWEFVEPKIPNILSEGVYEEGGQYAVEKGTYDYYTRKYTNLKDPNNKKNWDSLNEVMTSTSKGLADQFGSSEGIENMFVGALSALITGGIMGKIDQVKGQGKEARLQSAINSLNQYGLTGILQDKYTDTLNSVGIAQEMNAAAKSGNVYGYKNLKHDLFFGFVNSRIPSGMHETTIEQLKLLKDLPKEEFEKTFGMDFGSSNKKTVDEYVDGLIAQANTIKDTHDVLDSTYKNPFKQIVNPKTKEEAIETTNYFRFNNWKTELGWNLSVTPDRNSRLASIEQDVAKINPLVDNNLLSRLTKKDSLQELAKTYEEKANQLNKTITDYTTPENRKATKEQIKALRTQSEKINLAINNKDYNSKTFDDLLNFELNNQDATKSRVVGSEHSTNLFDYGFDINRLNDSKQATSEIFDNLTSKKGFEKFFQEGEDIADGKTPDIATEETTTEEPKVSLTPQFTNKSGVKESIDLNREYQIPTSKIAKIDKIADDRWQVTAPNGDVTFHTTEEKAKEIADELNSDFADLGKVKVLAINKDGTIKVEDLSGNIQNISPELLSGYERIQTEQEKLQKIAEEIAKQQDALLNKSGIIGTGNNLQDLADQPKESPKKSAKILFISGTTTSDVNAAPHIVRSREFLNNSADFKNRSNLRAILVTPNNEASLGLSGLAKLSYGPNDMSQASDVNLGFVAQVFVEQVGGKSYFVNKEGKQIGEVGKQVDLNEVIFETMPTTETTFLNGDPRYRSGEKVDAEAQAKSWGAFREGLFNAEQGEFIPYTFVVSRGIAEEIEVDGNKERNHVAGVLIDSKEEGKALRNEQLIQISTTGTIEHHGELINFPKGRPVLQHGDTLQFLNNRIFTSDEAQAIFEVIKNLSDIIVSNNKIDNTYASFLRNVLYWRKGATEKGTNQIRIDTANMTISLGGTSYDITNIASKEKEIVDQLKTTYNNVNNTTLKEGLNDKFLEFYMKDGKLVDNEWDNYQSYLLSSKFPNGTARPISETPLSTSVAKPTEAVPYSYKSKYATLQGVELPVQAVALVAPSAFPTIGGYELDGTTEHEFKLAKAANGDERIVNFTGSVDANGDINVNVISNDLTASIAANKNVVINTVIPTLTAIGKYDATRSDEQLVTDFIAYQITADLKNKQAAAPITSSTIVASPLAIAPSTVSNKDQIDALQKKKQTTGLSIAESATLDRLVELEKAAPTAPVVSDKKADIEKTLYGTISGSIPLSEALPNGTYIDLGNGLFAYADKNAKIAAIVDRANEYTVSKSFWNANTNKWQLPNEANLKDDAKRFGLVEDVYIKKYQDAVNVLNAKYDKEIAETERRRQEANNKNEKFWEQFTAINAEEVADRDNLINNLIKDILLPANTRINNWVLEELNGKLWEGKNIRGKEEEFFGKENWDKIKEAKNQFDIEFKKIEDSNLAKIKLIEQKQSDLLNTVNGLELRKAWSFGLIEEHNIVGLDETNFISKETEFKNGDLVETDNYEGYYYLSKPDKEGEWYEQIIGKTEKEVEDKINAKYDAELAALESDTDSTKPASFDAADATGPSNEYRRTGKGEKKMMSDAEIQLFKQWAVENVPFIPYEILDHIITTFDGEKAWGVFENGVAKFYKGGLRGTEYHEIFEAIYKGMLSPEQQKALLEEFKSKGGTFIDRETGKKIDYANATDKQAKERIADDFADFRLGKLPARSLSEKILNFFKAIIDFVKSFVNKPSLKQDLFKAINTGEFKERTLNESVKNEAAEYRAVEGLTEQQTHEFVQDMTARASYKIFGGNRKSIYDIEKIMSANVFGEIETEYIRENKRQQLGERAWKELIEKTKASIRVLGIRFNEEDKININDENVNKNDYAPDAFSVDWKKSAPFAIKFAVGTLPMTEATNQENSFGLVLPKIKQTIATKSIALLNYSRAFATIIDKLSNTTKVTKVVDKLINLARFDSNYVRLFKLVGGNTNGEQPFVDFSKFKKEDWRFFIEFTQTFTKQNPDAIIQYVTGDEVYMGSANLNKITDEVKRSWTENIKALATDKDSLIVREGKVYKVKDLSKISIKTPQEQTAFLTSLGIEFPLEVYNRLKTQGKDNQQKQFSNAVSSIREYLAVAKDIMSVRGKTLGINGQLNTLAELLVKVTNPNQDSTYRNVEDKQANSYSENNAPSLLENEFNESNTLEELLETRPELKDVFSKHSIVLSKGGLFIDKDGNKFKDFKVSYIQGTKLVNDDKGITTSKLTLGNRLTQEINQNLSGNYYILIPADGSTEWMMNLGNNIQFKDVESGRAQAKINTIFKGYLFDDVALALDASNRKQLKNVGDKATELRFFKDILSEKTLLGINTLITNNATQDEIEEYINTNIEDINASVKQFIDNQVNATRDLLIKNEEIKQVGENKFTYPKLSDDFAKDRNVNLNKKNLSANDITNLLTFARVNYVISNIEFHKILFGDPYQFAIKDKNGKIILDETKRIKSFLSPARTTFDTPEFNTSLNNEYNNVDEEGTLALEPTDPGYHQHKAYVNTFTAKDVEIQGRLLGKTNEADAASWIMDGTYREVLLKNHQWDDKAEAWHQYQMSYMRSTLARKGEYKYTNDKLKDHDVQTLSKPEPVYVTNILKPIVRGNKYNKNTVDLVLDKFSQMPVYYSMVEGTNLEKLYLKMIKEGFGYAIMESGRKVGIEEMQPLYVGGQFNEEAFNNKIQVPWKAYGIQVETAYESDKEQARGSQITKIASMDLFSDGVGSEEAVKEYARNTEILDRLTRNGYKTLLQKLGVEDLGDGFRIIDRIALSETLRSEMMRRELADNVVDSITLDKNGEFLVPFEASPAYIQIRNILYSIVDKSIRSPKVNGGGYIQAPVTMWESAKEGRKIAIKTEDGYKQRSREEFDAMSKADKAKVVLTDDTLKFYTKEDPYCEIMLPHWFKNKLNKGKYKTDKQLLDYLNKTEEGKSILRGIGFRIPTQSLSSSETFRVKGFLPQAMGKTVIVPSEITTKSGSDFDIDKLNIYLKSVYIDKNGDIKLVSLKDSEQANNAFYSDVFDSVLADKKIKKSELQEAADIRQYGLEDPNNLLGRYGNLLDALLEDVEDESDLSDSITKQLEKLGDQDLQAALKDKFVKEMYKRALENKYYDSLEKLITLPENYNRLIAPVDDAGLGDLADRLDVLRGENESLIKNRILDANYMTKLRHAFVTAKRWIGISAVNITNHSLTQKTKVYMDVRKFAALKKDDRLFLGDGKIALPHNTVNIDGNEYVSLSGRFDYNGKTYISEGLSGYATAFVDVAKDPYILKIVTSNLSVGTFMFLQRIGVPLETAAMFMSQPIIKEYLDLLDSKNANNLFDTRNIDLLVNKFPASPSVIKKTSIALNAFEDNIKNYYSGKEINNAEQRVILQEFLKYAKMADYNYKLSQATNYDTTKFRSGDSLFLKQTRTQAARESNIFSSVDNILDSTFIGEQAVTLDLSNEAIGQILMLEKPEFSIITEEVLNPYAENQFLGADNYEKIATKLKASFLDFIIQTNSSLADRLDELLKDDKTSVANQLAIAKKNHPEVKILNDLEIVSSDRIGGAKSVKLMVNTKSAYDENLYTGMMREMRDNPATNELYKSLVNLSILQGTYQSAISIRNIIPIEDYSAKISPIVSSLVADDTLAAFSDANLFQKNNWNDSDVVPVFEPKFKPTQDFPVGEDANGNDVYQYFNNLQFPNLEGLGLLSTDRRILELNSRYYGKYTQANVLTVPRVITTEDGEKVNITNGLSITGTDYIQRKNRGDLSLLDKFGYQKVKDALGEPLSYFDKKTGDEIFVYKLVNLYGDGQYASEYKTDGKPSIFNNGSVKVEDEMPDRDIENYYTGKVVEEVVPLAAAVTEEVKTPEVPAYEVNKELKNADGSKRFASTDGKKITINPVTSPEEFFNYFEGKEGGVTSQQKAKVLEALAGAGWSMDNIKSILTTNKLINTFLILHEQNHIDNNDKDVYWKNGKDLLTEDKIAIEVRATIDALEKLGGKPNTIELGNEEDPFTC